MKKFFAALRGVVLVAVLFGMAGFGASQGEKQAEASSAVLNEKHFADDQAYLAQGEICEEEDFFIVGCGGFL